MASSLLMWLEYHPKYWGIYNPLKILYLVWSIAPSFVASTNTSPCDSILWNRSRVFFQIIIWYECMTYNVTIDWAKAEGDLLIYIYIYIVVFLHFVWIPSSKLHFWGIPGIPQFGPYPLCKAQIPWLTITVCVKIETLGCGLLEHQWLQNDDFKW